MSKLERPLQFGCGADRMIGILTAAADSGSRRPAILIVVGGPQYRVGSHRQFVVQARAWSLAGHDVLRFDCRGMGDSEGSSRSFLDIQDDIRAAVDALHREVPGLPGVIMFGLCDAVPAILIYAPTDPRVVGLMLANPWVRSQSSEARATLKHYYPRRVLQASFWKRLLSGGFRPAAAWHSLKSAIRKRRRADRSGFLDAMLAGWTRFRGWSCVFISTADLTAAEFTDLCSRDPAWAAALSQDRVRLVRIADADHTFSTRRELNQFLESSVQWLAGMPP